MWEEWKMWKIQEEDKIGMREQLVGMDGMAGCKTGSQRHNIQIIIFIIVNDKDSQASLVFEIWGGL